MLFCSNALCQIKDIGGADYTSIFGNKAEPTFSRSRVWINFPIKLKKKDHILVNGLKYSNVKLDFDSNYSFDIDPLHEIHVLEYTLGYTFKMNEKWRFTAQVSPTISSNLANNITSDDLTWSGGVLFIRTNKEPKKSRLTLGLVYNQRIGVPLPLPFVTYFKEVNDHLTYTIGVPISKVKYFFNKKISVESFITLDGYYANLSNNLVVNNKVAENISMSAIITGIGFDKYIGKRLNLYVKAGYTLTNSLRLVENRNDEVFDFDMSKAFTLRGGLKFNF